MDDPALFETSASRFNAFSDLIGFTPATETAAAYYSPFKAGILYDEYDGTANLSRMFRGSTLLKVSVVFSMTKVIVMILQIYASIIRGPKGAKGLLEGKSKLPSANVIQRVHHIGRTTPAAIANCAVLVRLCSTFVHRSMTCVSGYLALLP